MGDIRDLEKELGIEETVPVEKQTEEGYAITSYQDAEAAFTTYAEAMKRVETRNQWFTDRVAAARARLDEINKPDLDEIKRMKKALEPWGVEFQKTQKTKTVKLLRGEIAYRDLPEGAEIDNMEETVSAALSLAKPASKDPCIPVTFTIKLRSTDKADTLYAIKEEVDRFMGNLGALDIPIKEVNRSVNKSDVHKYVKKTKKIPAGSRVRPKLSNASVEFKILEKAIEAPGEASQG